MFSFFNNFASVILSRPPFASSSALSLNLLISFNARNSDNATIKKSNIAVRKFPYLITAPFTVTVSSVKSAFPVKIEIAGVITSSTSDEIIFWNAPPDYNTDSHISNISFTSKFFKFF